VANIVYTPTREIVGGGGSITTEIEQWDRIDKWHGTEHVSLDGTTVSTLHRLETSYQVTCEPQDASQIAYFREFAASCANGETFTLDAQGIPDAPAGAITYRLKKNSYKEARTGTHLQPSFTIIKV